MSTLQVYDVFGFGRDAKPRDIETALGAKELIAFNPQKTKDHIVKLDALIEAAAKLREWPLLEQAIGLKIEEQVSFSVHWHRTLSGNWGGDRSKSADRGSCSQRDLEKRTGVKHQQVSRWDAALGLGWRNGEFTVDQGKLKAYSDKQFLAACRAAGLEPEENHRAQGTGENEWFTPPEHLAAARAVMGAIDLDPATHPIAQRIVQAAQFFTKGDDGLAQEWHGRVWMNPPYSQPVIEHFIDKLVAEVTAGRTTEAIALTHNYTDTAWFHTAAKAAKLICFTRGRVKFIDADGGTCAPTQGQAFFYFGKKPQKFREKFKKFGFIR